MYKFSRFTKYIETKLLFFIVNLGDRLFNDFEKNVNYYFLLRILV